MSACGLFYDILLVGSLELLNISKSVWLYAPEPAAEPAAPS